MARHYPESPATRTGEPRNTRKNLAARRGGVAHTKRASALRSFARFLFKTERLPTYVLEHLESCGDPGEPGARALTTAEARGIIANAQRRALYDKRARGNAALFWLFLCKTGLRANEAAKCRWSDVDLSGEPPAIYTHPSWSKNHMRQRVVLDAELIDRLCEHQKAWGGLVTAPVFPHVPNRHTWHLDRESAGVLRVDARQRSATMHSCRKWLATELDRTGSSPGVVSRILRHAGDMAQARYIDPDVKSEVDAIARLPRLYGVGGLADVHGHEKMCLTRAGEPIPWSSHASAEFPMETASNSARKDRPGCSAPAGVTSGFHPNRAGRSLPAEFSTLSPSFEHGNGQGRASDLCSTSRTLMLDNDSGHDHHARAAITKATGAAK